MTVTAALNKKPGLSLGKLSAVAQIAIKPTQPADAEIDLARIYSIKQVRKAFRNLEELAQSIKLNGIIEPLVVHEEADGRYRIIVGERRFRAAPLAGLAKVPVIIRKGLTELQIRRLQVTENNDRDDLTAFEEAMGVVEDVEQYGTKEAMVIWNRGEAWISKRMAVRRYADPVRALLEEELCGDFEVLHCLNQIFDLDETHTEFDRLRNRMRDGLPLSRDEVRNTLTRMKSWKQQQDDMAKRRQEIASAQNAVANTKANKPGTQLPNKPVQAKKQKKELTAEEVEAAKRAHATERLLDMRNDVFDWGEANQEHFHTMKTHMATMELDMHQTEWVLWQGFQAMVLPMLEGIGDDRAVMYLKKLQGDLKDKTPGKLWEEIHPDTNGAGRNTCPDIPEGWRF